MVALLALTLLAATPYRRELSKCFAHPTEQKAKLTLTIGRDGAVTDANVSGSEPFKICVLTMVRKWTFPPQDGGAKAMEYELLPLERDEYEPIVGEGGTLHPERIREVIFAGRPELKKCFAPGATQTVKIHFTVSAAGTVSESSVESDAAFRACVLRNLKRWRFPKPLGGGTVKVTYPLRAIDPVDGGEP